MAITVALGEDSYLVREGLEHLLAAAAEVEIVASCEDMDSLLSAVAEREPDVVLTDIRMPPTSTDEGIRVAAQLRDTRPKTGVVILSQHADPVYVLQLFEAGSEGRAYLLKERVNDRGELVAAIEAVARGDSAIDPKIVEVMVRARRRAETSPLRELTPRELEVLAAVARGSSNSAIADELVLTKRAVEKHINAIFLKLGLTHSAEADDISKRVRAALIYLAEGDLREGDENSSSE
jgi:DNA-binding NarL/FixJ family response regulator